MSLQPYLHLTLFFLLFCSCKQKPEPINFPETDLGSVSIMPFPKKIEPSHTAFGLDQHTKIKIESDNQEFDKLKNKLIEAVEQKTSLKINNDVMGKYDPIIIIKQINKTSDAPSEAYELDIRTDTITIQSSDPAGAFYGIQTLVQTIPYTSNDTLADRPIWVVPSGKISDQPSLEYRGMMLDVARHFFTVDEVKRLIDQLAYFKYNHLHLHLSDDQGWRIEIKSWPKLTEVGSAKEVGGGPGGFYTQEDYKELVAYAKDRFIDIVPEIDMPGHTNAASLSYPILNGNGKSLEYYTGMKVGFSTFAARKDTVYAFLDDVIGEIAAMSPSPYFHIGGDESHVTPKADYIYFVNRVQDIVKKHGKQLVGWNEIAQASLDPSSVVQLWNDPKFALMGAKQGTKILLSPAQKAYLDQKYDKNSKYGLTWAALIPLETAYNWNPQSYVEGLDQSSILGLEAPLWSETIENSAELEYLAFPRLLAYAELGWTAPNQRNWDSFKRRVAGQQSYFEKNKINYYPSPSIDWPAK